jgi:hydrogenase maturation protease
MERRLPDCSIVEHRGDGAALMERWRNEDHVIVIDAMSSGAAPGTIRRFEAKSQPLPATTFRDSSHVFGLAEAVELSRVLQQLPGQLTIYGVEAQVVEPGTGLSPAVEIAVEIVVQQVWEEIAKEGVCLAW